MRMRRMPTSSFQSSFFSMHHSVGVDQTAFMPSLLSTQVRVEVPLYPGSVRQSNVTLSPTFVSGKPSMASQRGFSTARVRMALALPAVLVAVTV